jgi:hypothetical protein
MGFSENPPLLSGRKIEKLKNFDWKKSNLRSDSRNLSGILIKPLQVENFPLLEQKLPSNIQNDNCYFSSPFYKGYPQLPFFPAATGAN